MQNDLGLPLNRPWGSTTIREVEPGTMIRQDITGFELEVRDDQVVRKDGVLYVTPRIFEKMKAEFGAKPL